MPRTLVITSRASLALEVSAFVIYDRLELVSLTVFEIVAFALVFVWLITLVVTTHPVVIHELSELEQELELELAQELEQAPAWTRTHRVATDRDMSGRPRRPRHMPIHRRGAPLIPPRGIPPAFARLS
jgi:hypothetical protein